jgi:hypothetical protein
MAYTYEEAKEVVRELDARIEKFRQEIYTLYDALYPIGFRYRTATSIADMHLGQLANIHERMVEFARKHI